MSIAEACLLLVTASSPTSAALSSVVSYPVLLAIGLSPLAANVTSTMALIWTAAIGRFIDAYNQRCQPFAWTKDADELIARIIPSKN